MNTKSYILLPDLFKWVTSLLPPLLLLSSLAGRRNEVVLFMVEKCYFGQQVLQGLYWLGVSVDHNGLGCHQGAAFHYEFYAICAVVPDTMLHLVRKHLQLHTRVQERLKLMPFMQQLDIKCLWQRFYWISCHKWRLNESGTWTPWRVRGDLVKENLRTAETLRGSAQPSACFQPGLLFMNGFSKHCSVCLQAHMLKLVFMPIFSCVCNFSYISVLIFSACWTSFNYLGVLPSKGSPSQVLPVSFIIPTLPVLCLFFILAFISCVSRFLFLYVHLKRHSRLCVVPYNTWEGLRKPASRETNDPLLSKCPTSLHTGWSSIKRRVGASYECHWI